MSAQSIHHHITTSPHQLDWTQYVRPDLVVREASVAFNTFWRDGEHLVHCVVFIIPKFLDPIQKDFKGTDAATIVDQVKTFLKSI